MKKSVGGHKCLYDYSLSEVQIVYKDVVIDVNMNQEVTEVEHPISTCQNVQTALTSASIFFEDVCVHRP